jgi:hypothetical protein
MSNMIDAKRVFESAVVERMPPSAVEAEEAVLGSVLIDPEAMERVARVLVPPIFSSSRMGGSSRHAWRCASAMSRSIL